MNKCETCKHWKQIELSLGPNEDWGDCQLLPDSDYIGNEIEVIETSKHFGCTLHEQKDGEK